MSKSLMALTTQLNWQKSEVMIQLAQVEKELLTLNLQKTEGGFNFQVQQG